jgi:hypothetical protein
MKGTPRKSTGAKTFADQWDGRDFLGRLALIMENAELFWDLRLITRSEIEMVMGMPESAREYIVGREEHPIFTSLELKENMETQIHRNKLEAALEAVFLRPIA